MTDVLVTGASGLVGSHLCKLLIDKGHNVIGVVHNRDNVIVKELFKCYPKRFSVVTFDIRDRDIVKTVFDNYKIHTVFHTAAHLPYTPHSDMIGVNLFGTFNVLDASLNAGVHDFIFSSSMSVYSSPPKDVPVAENYPTAPTDNYGRTKHTAETICCEFKLDMRIVVVRYSGVYGRGSDNKRVINTFINQAKNDAPITIDGDGEQSSDFAHVEDIAIGTYLAWDKGKKGVYNIGSGQEITLNKLADTIIELTGSNSKIIRYNNDAPRPFRFYLDISRAKDDLGYNPRNIIDGLRDYIEQQD